MDLTRSLKGFIQDVKSVKQCILITDKLIYGPFSLLLSSNILIYGPISLLLSSNMLIY